MQPVFLLLWPPFSLSMGAVDPNVRNPGENTAVRTYWGTSHLDYYLCLNHTHKECMSTTQLYSIKYWGAWAKAFLGDAPQPEWGVFSLQCLVDATKFEMPSVFILIEIICQKFLLKLLHCSKTSLLKLPIHLFTYFAIQHIRIHQQYTRNLKNIKDNRHYSNLNKCLNSELLATL